MKRPWAIALVLGAVLAGGGIGWAATRMGDDDPKKPAKTVSTTPSPTVVKLTDADLISVADLAPIPSVGRTEGAAPWQVHTAKDLPTLTCQADWLHSLGSDQRLTREFRVPLEPAGDYDEAEVRTAVLRFASEATAKAAYATVKGWITDCRDPLQAKAPASTTARDVDIDDGQGVRGDMTRSATEVCTECDALWTDAMVAAQIGDRVILIQHSELGGPLVPEGDEPLVPEGYDKRVSTTVTAVLRAGREG